MVLRLFNRRKTIKYLLVFVIAAWAYLYVLQALANGYSALEQTEFKKFCFTFWPLELLALYTFYQLAQARQGAWGCLLIYGGVIAYFSFVCFWQHFDKTILLLNVIYDGLFVYFLWALKAELSESFYHPAHGPYHRREVSFYNLTVSVKFKNGEVATGVLTNWSENSCFVALQEDLTITPGPVEMTITFENQNFHQRGLIRSSYGSRGLGITFAPAAAGPLLYDWDAFYHIIADRGFTPYLGRV